ncbi:MAG: hypothetical protein NTW86_26835 [Candidatus Sumerlaeota bacterium]|nr:hypothetical protein [Candidatus Sumerlaeota bacterium]
MSPEPGPSNSLANVLARWFWRDPDPVWRWASGQSVRRWWRHPLAVSALAAALFTAIVALTIAALVRMSHRPYMAGQEWVGGALLAGAIVLVVYASMFIIVSRRPFDILGQLGGPPMLREISLGLVPRGEIGRCLYWGSYRSAALPALALLYYVELMFLALGLYALADALPRHPFDFCATMIFWFVLKPPLDHAMNLAIAWHLYFRTGKKAFANLLSALLVMLVFPAGGWLLWMGLENAIPARASYVSPPSFFSEPLGYMLFLTFLAVVSFGVYAFLSRRRRNFSITLAAVSAAGLAFTWLWTAVLPEIRSPAAIFVTFMAILISILFGAGALSNRRGKAFSVSPAALAALGMAAIWLAAAFLPMDNQTASLFRHAAPFVAIGSALLVKAWFARRCYRKFIAEWDADLANRFGDAA